MLQKFYRAIFKVIDNVYKKRLGFVLLISIVASSLEITSISSIFPFMSLVTDPAKIHSNKYYFLVYNYLHFSSEVNFIIAFGVAIITLFILKTILGTYNSYISTSFGQDITKRVRIKLVYHYLHKKYVYYLHENKSDLYDLLNNCNNITYAVSGIGTLITEIFIIIMMYAILMVFNWKITLGITIFLIVNIIIVQKFLHPKISIIAKNVWQYNASSVRFINALVHNYKIIKLDANKQSYIDNYTKNISAYHYYDGQRMILERQPKNLLELSGFLIMIGLVIYQELVHGIASSTSIIPMMSLLMLAFYRFLPSVTRILEVKGNIAYVTPLMHIIQKELSSQVERVSNIKQINMQSSLQLRDINFYYNKNKQILANLSITIDKGEHIAFIGESGSGKSTLVDIIMGLYSNEDNLYNMSGAIFIDGNKLGYDDLSIWRQNIGYIPQEIYLFDGTVAENVAMNNTYNEDRVIAALKKAYIWDFLQQKDGLSTQVGDGGVMLSGGQKQRIGIARALYNDPEIIIMDEATSALDDNTESQIIEELNNSSCEKTIIMIAHRISSLKNCDRIYELCNGKIGNIYNGINDIK